MVPSRLLVFTDGIPTDENDYGSTVDLTRASTAGKYKVMTAVQRPFNEPVSLQARINFIGCGKDCDRVFLENAAKTGKGKFFRADDELDVRRLGGYYRRLVWVCRFICPFREKEFINQLVNTKNTFSTWMRATKSTEIFDTDLSDFDMDEMYEILQELIGPKALTDLDVEDLQRTALIQRELPLGIRVRRGPDWKYGDQDNNGPGTVSGYEKGGWVRVQWDHSNEDFVYRYGHDGRREVQAVDEPRILRDDEFIKPGVKVRRGPHWNAGNNDGGPGSIGTVYKVEEAGIVYVLWPTRVASNHRYGYDGRFEVELVEESKLHEGDEDGSGFITDEGKVALWQWNSNGNWTAYPKYVNTKLERSYRTRPSTSVEVNVAGLCQRINFESMTALCTDINETYEIQRTELSLEDFEAVRIGLEGY
ncbi:uncharacterized protein LOC106157408 [Lingula anatina]|uniref:Uncharacterized protein LOC106157408 n=1 Tax=Lingula anatina TaxID=7574 RepID=A0A1S3HTW2_LINAN|nr:uncharacterized protein LOC106157408 [Lingula anatina]|eukprot:XP_013388494.1 uncharacterized protein LOC106157408 [Lingula anatina]